MTKEINKKFTDELSIITTEHAAKLFKIKRKYTPKGVNSSLIHVAMITHLLHLLIYGNPTLLPILINGSKGEIDNMLQELFSYMKKIALDKELAKSFVKTAPSIT